MKNEKKTKKPIILKRNLEIDKWQKESEMKKKDMHTTTQYMK